MFTKQDVLAMVFATVVVLSALLILLNPFKKTNQSTEIDNSFVAQHDRTMIDQFHCYTVQGGEIRDRIGGSFIYLCMLDERVRLAKQLEHEKLLRNRVNSEKPQEYVFISDYYFPEFYYKNLPKNLKFKFYRLVREFNNRPSSYNKNPLQSKSLPKSHLYIWNEGNVSEYKNSHSVATPIGSFQLPLPSQF